MVVFVPDPEAHDSRVLKLLLCGSGCCGKPKVFDLAPGSLCQILPWVPRASGLHLRLPWPFLPQLSVCRLDVGV